MQSRDRILATIYATIDEINESLPTDDRMSPSEATVLFGSGARLDSLGLVTFIATLEQNLTSQLGLSVTLADEKAMSQRTSPFRTVQTLADYVEHLARGDA